MLGWVGRAREVFKELALRISPDGWVFRGGGWVLEKLWEPRVGGSWLGWVGPSRGHLPPPPRHPMPPPGQKQWRG